MLIEGGILLTRVEFIFWRFFGELFKNGELKSGVLDTIFWQNFSCSKTYTKRINETYKAKFLWKSSWSWHDLISQTPSRHPDAIFGLGLIRH